MEAQGEVTYDADGKPLRMLGTMHDITLKKETESALRKSEEKFYKAFQTSPDWIVISRATDGLYLEVNNAFLQLTGYTWDEVIGHTSLELGIWEDRAQRAEMLKVLAEYGRVKNFPVVFRDKTGGRHRMRWSAEVMEYQGEACFIAVAREEPPADISGGNEG
jgi:PAS domain S-box-containing protein